MNNTIKFLAAWIIFSIFMGIFVSPFFIGELEKNMGTGIVLGFFAGVLSQIEGNTRTK